MTQQCSEPKPGFSEMQELIQRMNPDFPPIADIEKEIKAVMERHRTEYKQELRQLGLTYNSETQKQDPWKGIYNYVHAEYRDSGGTLINESDAREKNAKIWIWREDNPSTSANKQADSTRDPKDPNFRFYKPLHPITKEPCPYPKRGWLWPYKWADETRDSFVAIDAQKKIVWGEDENKIPQVKLFLHQVETNVAKSVIHDYTDGEKQLATLFGVTGVFPTPKPSTLIERFILQTCKKSEWVLDFYGGSGTTAQSAMDASVILKGKLKFILVEVGTHFDATLLPRIKKLCFTPHWQDGKPKAAATSEEIRYRPKVINISASNLTRTP